jgi:hypothetical protein
MEVLWTTIVFCSWCIMLSRRGGIAWLSRKHVHFFFGVDAGLNALIAVR